MLRHVLVLRPREEARDLAYLLEDEGLTAHWLPVLGANRPSDLRGLTAAAEQLPRFGFLVPAGPAAVRALVEAAHAAGTLRELPRLRVLVPDDATGRAVRRAGGGTPTLVAVDGHADRVEALRELLSADDEVLLLDDEATPSPFGPALLEAGAQLTRAWALRGAQAPELAALPRVEVVVVHSPSAAEALLALPLEGRLEGARFVAAGPASAAALAGLGVQAHAVAAGPGADALAEATLRALAG